MTPVTRRHICAITVEAVRKLPVDTFKNGVELEMLKLDVDSERVVSVKREAYGTFEGKVYWSRIAVTELEYSP